MDQGKWLEQMKAELDAKKAELDAKENTLGELRTTIERLGTAISAMEGTLHPVKTGARGQRQISPEARQRIVEAQKKRWEKIRQEKAATLKAKQEKANQKEPLRAAGGKR